MKRYKGNGDIGTTYINNKEISINAAPTTLVIIVSIDLLIYYNVENQTKEECLCRIFW